MEGPSLVIATEELKPFEGQKIVSVTGSASVASSTLVGQTFRSATSWGKHLLLRLGKDTYRVHFLMFGSYRIDDRRAERTPKLSLTVRGHEANFYSCAIGKLTAEKLAEYDWSLDVMSSHWSATRAVQALETRSKAKLCDVLMDQAVFAGVGNIIKNEVLFLLRLHPESVVSSLTSAQRTQLVDETRAYCFRFYEWKKRFELKKNWKIFRKRKCPSCGKAVSKRPTGALQRVSHYCTHCQPRVRIAKAKR